MQPALDPRQIMPGMWVTRRSWDPGTEGLVKKVDHVTGDITLYRAHQKCVSTWYLDYPFSILDQTGGLKKEDFDWILFTPRKTGFARWLDAQK
jgi:hypothetical protein